MKPLNLESLKINSTAQEPNSDKARVRHEMAEPFLRGPIPLGWLEKAAGLGGKSLNISISLWFLAGVTKSKTVRFNQSRQERFGAKRDAARRALVLLENAGLISISRGNGRCPMVTLVEIPIHAVGGDGGGTYGK